MKRIFLTALAAGLATVSFAQRAFILAHQPKKGFITLAAGTSLPVGDFGCQTVSDPRAGMAIQGVAANVAVGYQFLGPVGLTARFEHHSNALKASSLLNALVMNEGDQWSAKAGNWAVSTLMGGPYVHIPFNGLLSLDARVMAGRASATCPSTSLEGTVDQTPMWVKTTGGSSTATSFGGGVTLRYRVGRSVSFNVNSDYTRANFRFDNLTSTAQTGNGRAQSGFYSSDQLISSVTLTAGVSILFANRQRPF
ncbi:hypothetical protein DYU11_01760 [Fibrisoma montanum]|uniref:Uncharacterized protein n=1 Tax=Fibrisoma montanum TaxID=2305895 RepID=A0A418MI18_9BACT|nr:outer membrane beta-barrel protein [Fibrisoma montanum]RIV27067.1 hypothetical protein DYU11_01760 [Fibrisoma montanum]